MSGDKMGAVASTHIPRTALKESQSEEYGNTIQIKKDQELMDWCIHVFTFALHIIKKSIILIKTLTFFNCYKHYKFSYKTYHNNADTAFKNKHTENLCYVPSPLQLLGKICRSHYKQQDEIHTESKGGDSGTTLYTLLPPLSQSSSVQTICQNLKAKISSLK